MTQTENGIGTGTGIGTIPREGIEITTETATTTATATATAPALNQIITLNLMTTREIKMTVEIVTAVVLALTTAGEAIIGTMMTLTVMMVVRVAATEGRVVRTVVTEEALISITTVVTIRRVMVEIIRIMVEEGTEVEVMIVTVTTELKGTARGRNRVTVRGRDGEVSTRIRRDGG